MQRIVVDANASWLRLMTSIRRASVILAAALIANSFAGTPACPQQDEAVLPPSKNTQMPGAPASSTGATDLATWHMKLAAHLRRFIRFPAGRLGQTARVVVTFRLDRTGHVVSAEVSQSSGTGDFDSAALAMIRRADPVPAPPPPVPEEALVVHMPVNFVTAPAAQPEPKCEDTVPTETK